MYLNHVSQFVICQMLFVILNVILNNFASMIKVEMHLDPTKELLRLISEHKYEEAFLIALQRSDVSIVSWLCSQVFFMLLVSYFCV